VNVAFVVSACVAVLQLGIGVLLVPVSRAPGWRGAWAFALIAFSGAGYSATNLVASYWPLSDSAQLLGAQTSYLAATVFVSAWLVSAFGGESASVRQLPRWCQAFVVALLTAGLMSFLARSWFFTGQFTEVAVGWAGVRYRFPEPALLGELVSYLCLAGVAVTCVAYCSPRGQPKRVNVTYVVGFSILLVTTVIDVLVTIGALDFLFTADLGFLAVVLSMLAVTAERFIDDARRLSVASTYLTEEIDRRTEERDEAQRAWIEAEHQAALGRLAAGVGHEINNPLAYLRLNLELMQVWGRDHGSPEELLESVEGALDGADRIRGVVDALRAYSRPATGNLLPISPEHFTQAALRVTSHKLRGLAEVRTHLGRAPEILGDEGRLVQAMVNLLLNAAHASPDRAPEEKGVVDLLVGTAPGGRALIEVRDNGPGMSREEIRRLTQPYFTTRFEAGGAGLGLFLARGVVEQMGGVFEVESAVGEGTLVRILLPPAHPEPASALEGIAGRVRSLTAPGGIRVSSARVAAIGR